MTEMWMPGAEQQPQPGGVTMNPALPSRVTWHITWDALTNGQQPSFDGVAGYLERQEYCPHLMWDPWTGRIVQFYPADQGGRALVNWNQDGQYNIQIETFFSPGTVRDGITYATVAETPCKGLDEILAWTDSLGIPRAWPMGAPQWAGNSRDPGIWNTQAGHYGHCNVPDNTHTDPGPMPDLNRGLAAMGGTITPISTPEGFLMALTDQQQNDLYYILCTKEGRAERAQQDANTLLASAVAMLDGGHPTIAELFAVFNDRLKHIKDGTDLLAPLNADLRPDLAAKGQQLANLPAAVLNQPFTLADGTKTNLAGILSALNAKPAGTTTVTNAAPAPFDVDALVARLKTELPAAVLTELSTKLTK